MSLIVSLTGSYPPLPNSDEEHAVKDAIAQQQNIAKHRNVNWLYVDGQPQNDIVGIFAQGVGLSGSRLPYIADQKIEHKGPITLNSLQIASKELPPGQSLKAHITGPTLMAQSCKRTNKSNAVYVSDLHYPRYLTLDLAHALATEANLLLHTPSISISHLQIDEPTLAYGANLDLAAEAIAVISQTARAIGIPVILHVCGNSTGIIEKLLTMPVDILNLEGTYLRASKTLTSACLRRTNKKLAIGCVPVNVTSDNLPGVRLVERQLQFDRERFGVDRIWGLTPTCGLRMSEPAVAQACMRRLVEIAERLTPSFV